MLCQDIMFKYDTHTKFKLYQPKVVEVDFKKI